MNRARAGGQIALPFVLLVGGIIVEIVIAGSIVSFFASASSLGERLSIQALTIANTGAYDALIKIASNKEFAAAGTTYEVTVGDDAAEVAVSRIVDGVNNVYLYTATSTSSTRTRERTVVATIVVDQKTGVANLRSIEEVAVQ